MLGAEVGRRTRNVPLAVGTHGPASRCDPRQRQGQRSIASDRGRVGVNADKAEKAARASRETREKDRSDAGSCGREMKET